MEKMMTVMTLVILFTYKLLQRQVGPTHGRKPPDLLHPMVFDQLHFNHQSHHQLFQLASQLTQHKGFPRQIPPWSPHFLQPVGLPLITNIGNLVEIFVNIWQIFANIFHFWRTCPLLRLHLVENPISLRGNVAPASVSTCLVCLAIVPLALGDWGTIKRQLLVIVFHILVTTTNNRQRPAPPERQQAAIGCLAILPEAHHCHHSRGQLSWKR